VYTARFFFKTVKFKTWFFTRLLG